MTTGAETLKGTDKTHAVRSMFGAIAPTYDLLNRLLSFGVDARWRKSMVSHLPQGPIRVLDLASGTGDVAVEVVRQRPEARVWGADCILVIMACVDDPLAHELTDSAHELGMDVLVEVHDAQELDRALKLDNRIIGINNRNLKTFDTKLETTEELAPRIPDGYIIVGESGISNHDDLKRLARSNVKTFLVGESLMRASDVTRATQSLLFTEEVSS